MVFKTFPELLTTFINFFFTSLKFLTNFENAYRNPTLNTLRFDWSIFSSADLSIVARKKGKN